MAIKALLLIFVSVDTVNAAGPSCVYDAPLLPKCSATCGGCGLSTCSPMEIYGATRKLLRGSKVVDGVNVDTLEEIAAGDADWTLLNADTSYLKKEGGSLCTLAGTNAMFHPIKKVLTPRGHKHFFDFKVEVQKKCIANPKSKTVTLDTWTFVDEFGTQSSPVSGLTHPCWVDCKLEDVVLADGTTEERYQCTLRTTEEKVAYNAKGDSAKVAKKQSALSAVGGWPNPCAGQDIPEVVATMYMGPEMKAQMDAFDISDMYDNRSHAIASMGGQQCLDVDEHGNLLPRCYPMDPHSAGVMYDAMTNPADMMAIMEKAMLNGQRSCKFNQDQKFMNMADTANMMYQYYKNGVADGTPLTPSEAEKMAFMVDNMMGGTIVKEDIKGKTALANGCECNMKYFNTNAEMLALFVPMTEQSPTRPHFVPQPCFQDIHGQAYTYNQVKNNEVELYKIWKFDTEGFNLGCDHYTCHNGVIDHIDTQAVSVYTRIASESFTAALAAGDIKSNADAATYMHSIYGESAARFELNRRLTNQAVGEIACGTVKDTFHANGCAHDHCPGSHNDGSTVYDHTHSSGGTGSGLAYSPSGTGSGLAYSPSRKRK